MNKLIGFAILGVIFSSNVNAGTVTYTGSFTNSNDMQLFDMAFPTGSIGGSIAAATVGFDPILSLFDSTGTTLLAQDDDSGPGLDSLIAGNLPIGSYILALTRYSFFPNSINDTRAGFASEGLNWSVTFTGPDDAIIAVRGGNPSAVPVPAAAWLFGSAVLGLFGLRRKLV